MSYLSDDDSMEYTKSESKAATVILMGRRRSGKSSILEAVFHKMKPWESVYLESTSRPEVINVASLIDINLMELPGQIDYFTDDYDAHAMFHGVGAIIYVIDAQDEYFGAVRSLTYVLGQAVKINPDIRIEVLVHKIDGLSEEFRDDTVRDIKDRTSEMLFEDGLDNFQGIDYYQTSIYDQSIYEVLSKIISRLIPELPSLEYLLDNFVQHSLIEKALLCDLKSKLYFVTDSSPLDSKIYEVCAEFIDLSIDLDTLVCPPEKDLKELRGGEGNDNDSEYGSGLDNSNGALDQSRQLSYGSESLNGGSKQKRLRCISRLTSGIKLYLHEMLKDICLIAFIRDDTMTGDDSANNAVLDYNAAIFRRGLERIFQDKQA